VIAIDRRGELGDGIEADVALEGRGDPRTDTHITGDINPFPTTGHTALKGGFEDDESWFDDVEHVTLHLRVIDTDEFFVEGDGEWGLATEVGHESPLALTNGLLDGMDIILRQQLKFIQCLVIGESAIGIHTELHLVEGEAISNTFDEVEFLVKIDGADLEFDAAEAFCQFLFETLEHLFVVTHPDEAVDGDTDLTAREGRIKQTIAILEIQQGGFQAEEHGGVVAESVVVDFARLTEIVANLI
jgi:hypothetical protein